MLKITTGAPQAIINRFGLIVAGAGLLLLATATPLFGADTADVTATVTVQNVSVTVTDGSVNYGTLGTTETEDTANNGGVNDSQTATNNGNVQVDLNIRGANTVNWTLAAIQGSDQYFHKFCTVDCDGSPTWSALATPGYTTLATGVAASGSQVFDLQIGTPTSTTNFTQQSATVTVQAVAS